MRKTLLLISITLASLVAVPAQAQDASPYIGLGIGQSTVDACGVVPAGVSCDDKSTAWRGILGYQVNRYFAVEGGYGHLGTISASGPGGSLELKADAFEASALGSLPLADRFSVYGRLGFHRTTTKLTSTVGLAGDETTTDFTFGMGAAFDFTKQIRVRAEWQRYSDVGGSGIGKEDIDVLGVALIYRFF
jgi:OOP family OmpA-OmpF porin